MITHGRHPCLHEERLIRKITRSEETQGREQKTERGRVEPITHDNQPNKRDEFALGPGRLMEEHKRDIMQFIRDQKAHGYSITETLRDMGVKRSPNTHGVHRGKEAIERETP